MLNKRKLGTYRGVEESAKNNGIEIVNPLIGTIFSIGDGNCIIKHIDNSEPNNLNNSSIVLQLTLGKEKYLFMADAEKEIEDLWKSKDESKKIEWTDVTVLKVGHHGSSSSSTQGFLDRTLPEIAIISVGNNNDYGHPNQKVIDRLVDICGISGVYRTDRDGTIYLENIGDTNKITKLKTNLDGNRK